MKQRVRAHRRQFGNMPPIASVNETQLKTIIEYARAVQQVNGLF